VCFENLANKQLFKPHCGHVVCRECMLCLSTCPLCRDSYFVTVRLKWITSVYCMQWGVDETVECIVERLSLLLGEPTQMQFCLNGRVLPSDASPKTHVIRKNDTIHVVLNLRGD
jgi:ferredoxin